MDNEMEIAERRTNLAVPLRLVARVEVQAKADRRPFKAELLTLLEEALDRRERGKVRLPNRGEGE